VTYAVEPGTIRPETTLADVVTQHPPLAAALDELGLDYCCGGSRRLVDACREAALDLGDTLAVLERVGASAAPVVESVPWADLGLGALTDHIESVHHAFLRREFSRLRELAERVESVHGQRHAELAAVRHVVDALVADLEPHLLREEEILFPLIRELDAATLSGRRPAGSLHNSIEVLTDDHRRVGELMAELRDLTDGYRVPDDACASYRSLYEGLAAFTADTHLHVHKENNVLFPAAVAQERHLVEWHDR
jgi:regulator of cell morphogenesis and NO signaling